MGFTNLHQPKLCTLKLIKQIKNCCFAHLDAVVCEGHLCLRVCACVIVCVCVCDCASMRFVCVFVCAFLFVCMCVCVCVCVHASKSCSMCTPIGACMCRLCACIVYIVHMLGCCYAT